MPSQEAIIQRLHNQMEFLDTTRIHHETWADVTGDSEIAQIHLEINKLLEKTVEKYVALIDRYGKRDD